MSYCFTPWRQDGLDRRIQVRRGPGDEGRGFVAQPRRRVVEQGNGALMLQRPLARGRGRRSDDAASRVFRVFTAGMLRCLATLAADGTPWSRPRERQRTPAAAAGRTRRDRRTSRQPA
ncbi:hypothetical protein GCM10010421_22370 [Streptomyces glaucus]|uniref:Transposase n=1 Tax=Streptomyces glaucus TaxID=284029 RepID=A0ABN3JKK4_9ACTN